MDWLTVPTTLGKRFRVLEPFAHGATGSLYVADESESGRRGLLKILSSVAKHREPERARLRRELTKQTTLASGRLVVPWASGETEGVTWLFRPWLDGVSLRVRLAQSGGPLPVEEALSIAAQVTVALDELHRGGLLHRDVKPGHVFLQTNGTGPVRAFLLEPGLCGALIRPGNSTVLGTPGYVAPEQLQGKLVSFRSDLYSLGCVMYEMLAGHPPFAGESEQAVLAAQLSGEPPALPLDLPEGIVAVLRSLLSREPQERPFSAQKLRRVLEPYAPDGTPMTRPPTSTFGTLPDPDKPAAKPAAAPSLPPPPVPSEALRAAKAPEAGATPSSLPPPRITVPPRTPGRPTARGLAPPPPPRVSAEETQQLDIDQFELVTEDAPADRTQELSAEHLQEVKPAPVSMSAAAARSMRERDDHTVPIRLEQVLAIAPARVRASAAPPPMNPPAGAEDVEVPVVAAPAPQTAPAEPQNAEPAPVAAALAPAAPAQATPAVTTEPTMFVEDEHQTLPFPGHDGAHGLPPVSGLFGALPTAPAGTNPFSAALTADDEDLDAQSTTVAPRPLAPYPDPNAGHYAGDDDDPTTALPAPSGLSPNTLEENNDEASAASRHLQDTLRPYLNGAAWRHNKWVRGGAVAAALVLGVLTVKALTGSGDDDKLAARDGSSGTAGAITTPPPPLPTVEPTPSVTALAAAPKKAQEQPSQPAESPRSAEPAAAAPAADAPSVEPAADAPAAQIASSAAPAPAKPRAPSEAEKRQQRREEKARAQAEKAARARAEKEAKAAAAKQSKAAKANASSDRTAKWNEAVEEARAHYAAKRYKQAAQAYERATQYDPTSDRTFSGLGTARFKAGDYKGAAAAYQRAVQLAPSNSVYHTSLARTYQQLGDVSKAKAEYKRAIALDPKNEGAKKSLKELGG